MSQVKANFESGDIATAGSAVAQEAHSARQSLSSEAVGAVVGGAAAAAIKAAQSGDNSSQAPERPANSLGQSIAEGISNAARSAENSTLGQAIRDAIKQGSDKSTKPAFNDGIAEGIIREMKPMYFDSKFKVTDKDRMQAKESLASGLSELIPDADRTLLKQMQGALIDGKLDQLTAALKQLSAEDPAKMQKFLRALNGQLGSIELSQDGKGNVLVYEKSGNTAVSINPKTGETTLRAVERQADGSVLLKPGEIINRQVGDVMTAIGDEATRGVVGPRYNKFDGYPFEDRLQYKQKLMNKLGGGNSGGGGGGGGGGDSSPPPSPPASGDSGLLRRMQNQIEKDKKEDDK